MKINRIDHVSINVNDLSGAKAFFLDWTFRRELKQEIKLLRLMQSVKAFYFDYSNEMNSIWR
ncbi:Uncharacterised protein [Mycobacteroides abscessus subsp. abscessus]|nr:Uncharacterised protein [Mycobacteroides abscessus subsp. abscessus]